MIMADFSKFSLDNLSSNSSFDFLKQFHSTNVSNSSNAYDFVNTENADSPYNSSNFSCTYVNEDDFCLKYLKDNRFSIMSLNIQCIMSKFSELKDFILLCSSKQCSPDIICLQELWSITDANVLLLPGYQPLIFKCRSNTQGGGVGIYLKLGINFQLVNTSIFAEKIFESILLEISYGNNKKFVIGSVYRSNSHHTLTPKEQFIQFSEYLSSTIEFNSGNNSDLILAGDFNLDILKVQTCNDISQHVDGLFANGFIQLITKPTRCTANSATCLDNFITNCTQDLFETCIITNRISDHFPIFFFKNSQKTPISRKYIFTQDFSKNNIEKFTTLISNLNWDNVLGENDPTLALDSFFDIFFPLYNSYFAPKKSKFNQNIHKREKWFTSGLIKSRSTKTICVS